MFRKQNPRHRITSRQHTDISSGDLEGTRQSGEGIDLKIANLAADGQILQYARDIAQDVLNEDPDLLSEPNRILNERLKTLFAKKVNWGMIS